HCVCAHALETAKQVLASLRFAQHSRCHIKRHNKRSSVPAFQRFSTAAGPRAQVNHDVRLKFEEVEPLEQLVAHACLQDGSRVVLRARTIKGCTDAGAVELKSIGAGRTRFTSRLTPVVAGHAHRAATFNFLRARAFMRFFLALAAFLWGATLTWGP